jgi:hypothetical protein
LAARRIAGIEAIGQRRAEIAAVDAGVHQRVADDPEHHARNRIERDVLQTLHGNVLGTDQACFKHGKAGGHEHDQEAADQEQQRVEDVFGFRADSRGCILCQSNIGASHG